MSEQLTDRQREVLSLITDHNPSLTDLEHRLGITKSTIRDHVRAIKEAGYTITKNEDGEFIHHETPELVDDTNRRPGVENLPSSFVSALRDNGLTYEQLNARYGWSTDKSRTVLDRMAESGWCIDYETVDSEGTRRFFIPDKRDKRYQIGDGDGTYRFGLISDTHLGSTAAHLGHLHDFYDKMQRRGVEIVLHAGDISDGWEVHRNQINEVHAEATGWDRLKDYVVEHYPQRDGVETLFISGNHDRKLWRREGIRFSELVANERDDLTWLGDSMARLVFDPATGFDLELIHPSGGQPYTLGYRAQTLYREQPTDIRPNIACIGHLHGRMQAAAEGVESFYTGCWKDLTTYGKRKGHAAEIGGWDVEIEISDGSLDRLVTSWERYPAHADSRGGANLPNISDVVAENITADADGAQNLFG